MVIRIGQYPLVTKGLIILILTIEEARDKLRIDGEDNDQIILSLLEAIPDYLEVKTGHRWDEEPIYPLAKTTAGFILELWYFEQDEDTEALKRTIDNLLVALTIIGRNKDNG